MDTSETYIEMCEQAMEIQEIVKPKHAISGGFQNGDWVYCHTVYCLNNIPLANSNRESYIWLPRQDQLQAMVVENYVSHRKMFVCFGYYCAEYGDINYSGEKLWLMFVMYKKHNKEWVNGDWISIDSHT